MCFAIPTSSENSFTGEQPGPLKIFFGGTIFIMILFFFLFVSWFKKSD